MDKEISTLEASKLLNEEACLLLDVREPDELEICAISGARHIPMMEIPERMAEIPKNMPLVIFCHHGMRSMKVLQFLTTRGYDQVFNLKGGIDAWALSVDTKMPRY